MAALSAIAGIAGSVISAVGTIMSGQAAAQAAEYQARQLEVKAAEEQAAAQREAIEQGKEGEYVQSRIQSVAAASGLGASDPTVLQLASDVAGETAYRKGMTRYGGLSRATGFRAAAEGARMTGQAQLMGSYFGAAGTLLEGGTSLYAKYGGGGVGGNTYNYYYG